MWKLGRKRERGFTLIEILIVLAVLAILAAVVVPNVYGFVTQGKDRAYKADQRMLQASVDAWRTDISTRAGNPWPVLTAVAGSPSGINGDRSFIDVAALATATYLQGNDTVKSADTAKNNTATNSPAGSYGWYIDASGRVKTDPTFTTGTYP